MEPCDGARKPHWKRRLIVAMAAVSILSAGLWLNALRLNSTERRLVGIWYYDYINDGRAHAQILLPDRTRYEAFQVNGRWRHGPGQKWRATADTFFLSPRPQLPSSYSVSSLWGYLKGMVRGRSESYLKVDRLTPGEFVASDIKDTKYPRSRAADPELLRIFDQLQAGDSTTSLFIYRGLPPTFMMTSSIQWRSPFATENLPRVESSPKNSEAVSR